MKFKDYKASIDPNSDIFHGQELLYKNFFILSFNEFLKLTNSEIWELSVDDESLNSYPNFMQKHPLCISCKKYKNNAFGFRICCENKINGFGYRLFIKADERHRDFFSDDSLSDDIALTLKTKYLSEFDSISMCGWWITDIWRELFKISDESDSGFFINDIISHQYTKDMLNINDKLLKLQNSGEFNTLINSIKNSLKSIKN